MYTQKSYDYELNRGNFLKMLLSNNMKGQRSPRKILHGFSDFSRNNILF